MVLFLERLNELKEAYDMKADSLLLALPELLKGKALLWYRNYKSSWKTWADFVGALELNFLPTRYREKLAMEIRTRTQGPNEPFHDFLVAIQTLMRRHGCYPEQQQFVQIYENMLPEYKLYGIRQGVMDLGELIQSAGEYESIKQAAANYHPPTNPAQSLYPETAYRSHQKETWARVSLPPQYHNDRRGYYSRDQHNPHYNQAQPSERERTCWNCDKPGHYSHDCRLPRRDHLNPSSRKSGSTHSPNTRNNKGPVGVIDTLQVIEQKPQRRERKFRDRTNKVKYYRH